VRAHPISVGHAVADQQGRADHRRSPRKLRRDLGTEPVLAMERAENLPDIDDLGLQLDEQERSHALVPGDDVDNAAVAVVRERDLRPKRPPRQTAEPAAHVFRECRMPGAHEPIELRVPGSRQQLGADLQRGGNPTDDRHHNVVERASLDPRDRPAGNAGGVGEVKLAPAAADPYGADDRPEPEVIHRPR